MSKRMKTLRDICYIGAVFFLGVTIYIVTNIDNDKEVIPYKTIKPFTDKEKDSLEKQVEMPIEEIHIDNHEIEVNNEVWRHLSSCKECLKRRNF